MRVISEAEYGANVSEYKCRLSFRTAQAEEIEISIVCLPAGLLKGLLTLIA